MSWIEASYLYGKPPLVDQLTQWLSWAKGLTNLQLLDDTTENSVFIAEDLTDLQKALIDLDQLPDTV